MTDAREPIVLHLALSTPTPFSNLPTPRSLTTPPPAPSQPYASQSARGYLVFEEPDDSTAQRASRESLRLFRVVQESYLQRNGTHS